MISLLTLFIVIAASRPVNKMLVQHVQALL